jgi:hypothetical protein
MLHSARHEMLAQVSGGANGPSTPAKPCSAAIRPVRPRDAGPRASARQCWRSAGPAPGHPVLSPGWNLVVVVQPGRLRGGGAAVETGTWRPLANALIAAGPGSVSWRGCRRWTGAGCRARRPRRRTSPSRATAGGSGEFRCAVATRNGVASRRPRRGYERGPAGLHMGAVRPLSVTVITDSVFGPSLAGKLLASSKVAPWGWSRYGGTRVW